MKSQILDFEKPLVELEQKLDTRWTASTAAHRTGRLPILVIRPRCTVVSDS